MLSILVTIQWFTLVQAVCLLSTAGHMATAFVYWVKITEVQNQPVTHHMH